MGIAFCVYGISHVRSKNTLKLRAFSVIKVPFFSYCFGFLLILRPEVIQVVPGTPTDIPKATQRRSIGFIFVPRTRMDMPNAPQTQSIGVIFAALGYPTRLHGTPKLTLEGHPWTGWLRCGLRVSFSLIFIGLLIVFRRAQM